MCEANKQTIKQTDDTLTDLKSVDASVWQDRLIKAIE